MYETVSQAKGFTHVPNEITVTRGRQLSSRNTPHSLYAGELVPGDVAAAEPRSGEGMDEHAAFAAPADGACGELHGRATPGLHACLIFET